MELSVIIVNYNVKLFLEQALRAVKIAGEGIEYEVFVVDNNSADGSCSMVTALFPEVHLIRNRFNAGFSAANNMAMRQARGKYILILNPDTLIGEECFRKCISFMDENPDAGAAGVRMINGKGRFLPESKRNFPSPLGALYQVTGLTRLFSGLKRLDRYYAPGGDTRSASEVQILSGAFMFLRKEALDKAGLFDEDFFMYGEDIDLSHRIVRSGYRNYYLPDITIVHYKGESMRRGDFQWTILFYRAMLVFSDKYFRTTKGFWFNLVIRIAIILRASLGIVADGIRKIFPPLLDGLLIYTILGYLFLPIWERLKLGMGQSYPPELLHYVLPAFCLLWVAIFMTFRVYRKPFRPARLLKTFLPGLVITLAIYGVLPDNLRFSRFLVAGGGVVAVFISLTLGIITSFITEGRFAFKKQSQRRVLVAGSFDEFNRISQKLESGIGNHKVLGRISSDKDDTEPSALGNMEQLAELVRLNKPDEIIFCTNELSTSTIINCIRLVGGREVIFKVAFSESIYALGSNSSEQMGEYYHLGVGEVPAAESLFKKIIRSLF